MSAPTGPAWEAATRERSWLIYKLVPQQGGRLDKLPAHPRTGAVPVSVYAAAVLTFDEAFARAAELNDLGIGYLPSAQSEIIGVDLDDAFRHGQVAMWAADWIDLCPSWIEISPSGSGLRIIAARCGAPVLMSEARGVGYYGSDARFFSITLNLLPGRNTAVCSAPALVKEVLAYLDQTERRSKAPEPPDPALRWFEHLPEERQDQEIERMLDCLIDPQFGEYETWLRISLAVYRATDSCGFAIWDAWCQKLPGYHAEQNAKKWASFHEPLRYQRVTVGTLVYIARVHGYQPPPDAFDRTFPTLASEDLTRLNVIAKAAAARERTR